MTREWKPGDVALRVGHFGRHIALRVRQCPGASLGHLEHWHFVDADVKETQCGSDFSGVAEYRPLVVIDPDSAPYRQGADVHRFLDSLARNWSKAPDEFKMHGGTALLEWLRDQFEPPPPRPEEPTGLGAVVEDAEGRRWTRADEGTLPWHGIVGGGATLWENYARIGAVKVLSDGVPS
jgi:hypothetical protein